jgi:hypothetical protein
MKELRICNLFATIMYSNMHCPNRWSHLRSSFPVVVSSHQVPFIVPLNFRCFYKCRRSSALFTLQFLVLRFYVVILSREAASSAEAPGVMSGANGTWCTCVSTKVGSFEDATTNETSSVLFILFAWDQLIFLDHSCKLIFK